MLTRSITGVALCAGSPGLLGWCIIHAFEPLCMSGLHCIAAGKGWWAPGGGATIWVPGCKRQTDFSIGAHSGAVVAPLFSEALRCPDPGLMSTRVLEGE